MLDFGYPTYRGQSAYWPDGTITQDLNSSFSFQQNVSRRPGGYLSLNPNDSAGDHLCHRTDLTMLPTCHWLRILALGVYPGLSNMRGHIEWDGSEYRFVSTTFPSTVDTASIRDWIGNGGHLIVPTWGHTISLFQDQDGGWDGGPPITAAEAKSLVLDFLNGDYMNSLRDLTGIDLPNLYEDPAAVIQFIGDDDDAGLETTVLPNWVMDRAVDIEPWGTTGLYRVESLFFSCTLGFAGDYSPILSWRGGLTVDQDVSADPTENAGTIVGDYTFGDGRITFFPCQANNVIQFLPFLSGISGSEYLVQRVITDYHRTCWVPPALDDDDEWELLLSIY